METHTYCNVCGKAFDIFDRQADFKIINPYIGYGSIHDGESCDLHMCCGCFDRVMAMQFAIDPFSVREEG